MTGGLGGFGLAVAEFLGWFGAKHIIITSKRGVRNGNQQAALQELYYQNINVRHFLHFHNPRSLLKLLKILQATCLGAENRRRSCTCMKTPKAQNLSILQSFTPERAATCSSR